MSLGIDRGEGVTGIKGIVPIKLVNIPIAGLSLMARWGPCCSTAASGKTVTVFAATLSTSVQLISASFLSGYLIAAQGIFIQLYAQARSVMFLTGSCAPNATADSGEASPQGAGRDSSRIELPRAPMITRLANFRRLTWGRDSKTLISSDLLDFTSASF
jgi:hypothetical protein